MDGQAQPQPQHRRPMWGWTPYSVENDDRFHGRAASEESPSGLRRELATSAIADQPEALMRPGTMDRSDRRGKVTGSIVITGQSVAAKARIDCDRPKALREATVEISSC